MIQLSTTGKLSVSGLQIVEPGPIAQRDLERLIALRNQLRRIKRLFRGEAADILDRLSAGCAVEPGAHCAELVHLDEGHRRIIKLRVE